MMREMLGWRKGLAIIIASLLLLSNCGAWGSMKKWAGYGTGEEDVEVEDKAPPESREEQVMGDGKPYVRSKNPYYLMLPDQPEYIYVEKGTELKGCQAY